MKNEQKKYSSMLYFVTVGTSHIQCFAGSGGLLRWLPGRLPGRSHRGNSNCTANDVRLTSIVSGSLSISEGCTGLGNWCFDSSGKKTNTACNAPHNTPGGVCGTGVCLDTVTFSAVGQFQTGQNQRYDAVYYLLQTPTRTATFLKAGNACGLPSANSPL